MIRVYSRYFDYNITITSPGEVARALLLLLSAGTGDDITTRVKNARTPAVSVAGHRARSTDFHFYTPSLLPHVLYRWSTQQVKSSNYLHGRCAAPVFYSTTMRRHHDSNIMNIIIIIMA